MVNKKIKKKDEAECEYCHITGNSLDILEHEKKCEKRYSGIGGWLILPIIGLFFNIISLLIIELNIISILIIILWGTTLYFIFQKRRIARTLGIFSYAVPLLIFIFTEEYTSVLGSFIWMLYFIESKRVKNTFIN